MYDVHSSYHNKFIITFRKEQHEECDCRDGFMSTAGLSYHWIITETQQKRAEIINNLFAARLISTLIEMCDLCTSLKRNALTVWPLSK